MKKRRLGKGDLCRIFGLYSSSSNANYYHLLRNDYFTPDDLEAMEITQERYDEIVSGRQFTFAESRRIIEYFKIEADELLELIPRTV